MIKSKLKSLIRKLGFEVSKYTPERSRIKRLGSRMKTMGVDLVLDVGANAGQFARELRESGYHGQIISFEPLSSAHKELVEASSNDPLWQVAPRSALGASIGEAKINISSNSWSSSLLPMTRAHIKAAPSAKYVGTEVVKVETLVSLAYEQIIQAKCPYLKIDTQGYESEVIAGAANVMHHLAGIQMELSLESLYEGQPDFLEMIHILKNKGFNIFGIDPEFFDPLTSRLLQVDAIFINSNLKI